MSRCFPFPPPGYERKAAANNVDLLKQEKDKEKKHKKEKRDKEKREGKEKKEKDRGDEKHRDKKDKRRDKKDKGKEKDRISTSYEIKKPIQSGYTNEEKVLKQKGAPTFPALETGEKSIQKEKDEFKNSVPNIKRPSVALGGQNSENVISTNHVAAGVSDDKCVQELAKRLKTDQCSGSEQTSGAPNHRKNDGKDQLLGKAATAGLDGGKEWTQDRRRPNNEQKLDVSVNKEQPRLNGTFKVQSLGEAPPGQKILQEIPKLYEVNAKKMEWREIVTGREDGDLQGDKLKDKYIDKSQGKVKESGKKEEKAKEKGEQKHMNQENLKAGNKNGVLGSPHLKSQQSVKEPNRTVAAKGNLKKRTESETNGFLHGDDEVRANKLQKQAQPPMENGIEAFKISTKITPPRTAPTTNNVKVNKEEKKINGVKESGHASPISHMHSYAAAAQAEQLLLGGEASSSSVKPPPHPDSKFLVEILKVPKLDELPDLGMDDQGWLFSKKKSNGGGRWCVKPEEEEVWGECIHIESADIYALPYVFPY